MRRFLPLLAVTLIAVVGACGDDGDGGGADGAQTPSSDGVPQKDRGRRLFEQRGCLACHTTGGGRGAGPTLQGLAGSEVKLEDGRTVTADRDYLLRSILDPSAETVAGYPQGLMAGAIPKPLTKEEAEAVVTYLQGL